MKIFNLSFTQRTTLIHFAAQVEAAQQRLKEAGIIIAKELGLENGKYKIDLEKGTITEETDNGSAPLNGPVRLMQSAGSEP